MRTTREAEPMMLSPSKGVKNAMQSAADEALINELREQLDEQRRQLEQHQSREVAHAQELNALGEELLQATLGPLGDGGVDAPLPTQPAVQPLPMPAPAASYEYVEPVQQQPTLSLAPEPVQQQPALSLALETRYVATPTKQPQLSSLTDATTTEQPVHVGTPVVAPVMAAAHVHEAPQGTSVLPAPAPPQLTVQSQTSCNPSRRGRAPSPTLGRVLHGAWSTEQVDAPLGRSLTPRGSAQKVLHPVVAFDASGRAPSPRRTLPG